MGAELGESIIEDVKGVSVVVRRSLRDLLHQIPSLEVGIQVAISTIPFFMKVFFYNKSGYRYN